MIRRQQQPRQEGGRKADQHQQAVAIAALFGRAAAQLAHVHAHQVKNGHQSRHRGQNHRPTEQQALDIHQKRQGHKIAQQGDDAQPNGDGSGDRGSHSRSTPASLSSAPRISRATSTQRSTS